MAGSSVSSIRNLGPSSEAEFARAGIHSAEELHAMGANAAYAMLLANGARPHFIGYYALVMGLQGRPWNDCKGKEKEDLRRQFDGLVSQVRADPHSAPTGIEAELDRIGTGLKRSKT
ncbi:TfoX/Sxy family protein [Celeribacter arenosi]|uniref:TfoX C-terminal domain-containing protein n=1 Tax=Celeribacter arenosi TaxID=792649 RepID=A0ABP7KEI2_9RHOB